MTEINLADTDVMDFTDPPKEIQFKFAGDTFHVVDDLPVEDALMFEELTDKMSGEATTAKEALEAAKKAIRLLLVEESAERFIAGIKRGAAKPIGVFKMREILDWIMEEMGKDRSLPLEDSSDGSNNQELGTNSTDNAQPEELILET